MSVNFSESGSKLSITYKSYMSLLGFNKTTISLVVCLSSPLESCHSLLNFSEYFHHFSESGETY